MKDIKISNYSIYGDGRYDQSTENFINLYKGVRVNVNLDGGFSIRKYTSKFKFWRPVRKDVIWVKPGDVIDFIWFMDSGCSIFVASNKTNKSTNLLSFKKEVYEELKANIPEFLIECGVKFTESDDDSGKMLEF